MGAIFIAWKTMLLLILLMLQLLPLKSNTLPHSLPAWPPSSPDLNPIEEIWRWIKDYLYRLPEHPTTVRTMEEAVWGAWVSISDEDCK